MPDKHEVGGSSPLGPTSETQSVSQVIGNNEEGRSEVLGREGTDSQFVVIDTFLEKRRAKGTNRVTKVSDVSEIITVTRRKVSLLTFLSERGTFLEKRTAKGTNRVTDASADTEDITVTRRKVSLLTFLFKESK